MRSIDATTSSSVRPPSSRSPISWTNGSTDSSCRCCRPGLSYWSLPGVRPLLTHAFAHASHAHLLCICSHRGLLLRIPRARAGEAMRIIRFAHHTFRASCVSRSIRVFQCFPSRLRFYLSMFDQPILLFLFLITQGSKGRQCASWRPRCHVRIRRALSLFCHTRASRIWARASRGRPRCATSASPPPECMHRKKAITPVVQYLWQLEWSIQYESLKVLI